MRSTLGTMSLNIENRGLNLPERMTERLERAAKLYCADHGQPVMAVTINGRENGWFDTRWTTCCEGLEQQAAAIVKERY